MSTIVTRVGKGSPLTWTEVDSNFTNLNTDKLQSGNTAASLTITSATINGGSINGTTIGGSTASSGTFSSLSDSGNLTFTGTGNRITGDFINATLTNRVLFQSSTTNSNTSVGAIPNGTANTVNFRAYGASDPTNSSFIEMAMVGATDARFTSNISGTGTYLPITFYTGGSERMRIDTSGNLGIGTASPTSYLSVNVVSAGNGINVGDFNSGGGSGAYPAIQTLGSRNDGNGSFFGRFGAAFRRFDGTAITSATALGTYAFGGQWGTDTTYQSAKLLYPASIKGVAEGSFTSATAMPTAITFSTGSTGDAIGSVNLTYGTERMRITSAGNVGIGATNPTEKLTVVGNVRGEIVYGNRANAAAVTAGGLGVGIDGNVQAQIVSPSASAMAMYTGGTERMRIDSSGNVGIGTTSISNKFTIVGTTNDATSGTIKTTNTNAGSTTQIGLFASNGTQTAQFTLGGTGYSGYGAYAASNAIVYNNDSLVLMADNAAGVIKFAAGGSAEKMRIDSSGNVLVGNTAGYLTNAKLLAYNTNSANGAAMVVGSAWAGDVSSPAVLISKLDNNTTTSQVFTRFYINGSTACGQINANGASTAAFGTASDERLKENITDLPPQLNNIMSLRPTEFDYKDGSGHQIGFIAQEMQQVYPDVVGAGMDDMMFITGWDKTSARLVKAIQEQQTIINDLKARITILEGK